MAAAPVVLGGGLAWSAGHAPTWWVFGLTLYCALAIQAGTNLYNDARDGERGADGPDRVGPVRVTAAGLASPAQVRRAAYTAFATAVLTGIYLVTVGGMPILVIGIASIVAGLAYSGGPRPLSHSPLGELFVVLFFGVAAVSGSFYLQAGHFAWDAVLLGAALGLQAAAVLLVNNIRDLSADRAAGRRTLAGLLGEHRARRLYAVLMLAPFTLLMWLPVAPGLWLLVLVLPPVLWLVWRFRVLPAGAGMNRHLAWTAQAQVLLAAAISVGLLAAP